MYQTTLYHTIVIKTKISTKDSAEIKLSFIQTYSVVLALVMLSQQNKRSECTCAIKFNVQL